MAFSISNLEWYTWFGIAGITGIMVLACWIKDDRHSTLAPWLFKVLVMVVAGLTGIGSLLIGIVRFVRVLF